jgi:Protein of unknown function (DUF3108)
VRTARLRGGSLIGAKTPELSETAAAKGKPKDIQLRLKSAFAAAIMLGAASPAFAANTFKSEFSISLYGLPLAKTRFTTVVDKSSFNINGAVNSAGVGALFDDTKGTVTVSGTIGAKGTRANNYALSYVSGKRNKSTNIGFSGGSVVSAANVPPVTKKGEWVDLQPGDLKAVTDPLTGMMVRASSLEEVCNRTARVFDGQTRADFVMSLARMSKYKTKGYSGPVAECAARFVPVSGYQKGKKQLEFLRKNKNIRIIFAPVGDTGLYAPIAARVGTTVGTVSVDAVRFEAVN